MAEIEMGMGTMKAGALCAGGFEQGNAIYWEVRRNVVRDVKVWLLYRTSMAVMLMGEYSTSDEAYEEYFKHVPSRSYDDESRYGG